MGATNRTYSRSILVREVKILLRKKWDLCSLSDLQWPLTHVQIHENTNKRYKKYKYNIQAIQIQYTKKKDTNTKTNMETLLESSEQIHLEEVRFMSSVRPSVTPHIAWGKPKEWQDSFRDILSKKIIFESKMVKRKELHDITVCRRFFLKM